jgi:glycine C-acetyltransferase
MRRLCDEHGALLGVDDCHATGVMGPHGRGTAAHCGVSGRVDLITGTFGKALGGASGGFTACSRPVAELLRQRSRPYLFSNTLAPSQVGAALAALDLLERSDAAVQLVQARAARFRAALQVQGHTLIGSGHPIVSVLSSITAPFARRSRGRGGRSVSTTCTSRPMRAVMGSSW